MQSAEIKITSRDNRFQHAEVLKRSRHKRFQFSECFVEGVESINMLKKFEHSAKVVISQQGRVLSSWAHGILEYFKAAEKWSLEPELFRELSEKEEPSELLVLANAHLKRLEDLAIKELSIVLLFDRPKSPGNFGSAVRSAAAFGAEAIIISGHAADPFDPASLRASMGTIFSLPIVALESLAELESWIATFRKQQPNFMVYGTSHHGSKALHDLSVVRPCLLMMGNETSGLSSGLSAISDTLLKIELSGPTTSLNLSCATSIFLYEFTRLKPS